MRPVHIFKTSAEDARCIQVDLKAAGMEAEVHSVSEFSSLMTKFAAVFPSEKLVLVVSNINSLVGSVDTHFGQDVVGAVKSLAAQTLTVVDTRIALGVDNLAEEHSTPQHQVVVVIEDTIHNAAGASVAEHAGAFLDIQ
jgi:hypothetical protein